MRERGEAAAAQLAIATCTVGALIAAAPATAVDIELRNAWTRPMVEGYAAAAAYVDIRSDVALKLVGATSPAAKTVAIVVAAGQPGGTIPAKEVRELEVPAGRETRLALNGNYLELRDVIETKLTGTSVPLKLEFTDERGKKHYAETNAVVRGVVPRPMPPATPLKPAASPSATPPAPSAGATGTAAK